MITARVTKKGRILQNKQINGADLKFTRVVSSTTITPLDELQNQTTVTNVVQTFSIQSVTLNPKDLSYTILVLLTNTGLKNSYNLNQIGFYANDPNDGEILFAVAQFNTPKKIESQNVNPGYTLEIPFNFQNSGNADVIIEFDPENLMSREGVQAMLNSEEISDTVSGNAIAVYDSTESPFLDFKVFGKSEQITTKGYQLFDASRLQSKSGSGCNITNNGDGSFTISGSGTLSDGVWTHYTLTDEEYSKIMQVGNILYVNAMPITNPFVFFGLYDADNANIASLSNRQGVNEKLTITQELIEQSEMARFYILGNANSTIKSGTIKPMYYMEGDGAFEPFSGGKPSPCPDFPQEIDSTGEDGSLALNVQGKNLWVVDNTNDTLTYDAATQIMTINGPVAQTLHELPVPIPKGTRITISAKVVSGVVTSSGDGGLAFGGYHRRDKYGSWQGYINIPKCSVADLTGQEYKEIFETTEEVTHFYAFAYAATASIHEPLKVKVQYEINDYATEYEPHKAGQMANIPLPLGGLHGIPVSSGGNYTDKNGQQWICDEINLAKRKYIQRIKRLVLDGTEQWGTSGGQYLYLDLTDYAKKGKGGFCSHFRFWYNYGGDCIFASEKWLYLGDIASQRYNLDVGIWKNFLAQNNVTVLYELETQIETDLTDEQIAAFEALLAYEDTTTILMDSIGNMEVTYFKNTVNGKSMGILKSEHLYLKKLIGDVNAVVQNLVG